MVLQKPSSLLIEHDGFIHFDQRPLDHRFWQSVPLQYLIIERHQHFELGSRRQQLLWTDLWRRHSTSSSAKVTLEAKAMKYAPARSNNSKPMKLRSQITLAIEHIEMTSNSRE
jgi:hypothetical protein